MLQDLAEEYRFQILAMEVMPDHIHMLVDCRPQFYISDMIKIMKGNLARQMFLLHPELKKELWGGHLWNPSYYAVTVSDRSREQVSAYIEGQKEKEKRKPLIQGSFRKRLVFAGKVEEDADSIQLWCGDTKTEYPGPSDNGDLSSGSRLPDRDLRTGLGRTEEDSGDKKAF